MEGKRLKHKYLILAFIVLFTFLNTPSTFGQEHNLDSTQPLSYFLNKGELKFKSRTFFMSTINNGVNNDFFALATGAGVDYTTPYFYGFRFRIGGHFTFRLAESNLVNSYTNNWTDNRYEKALFDIMDSDKYKLSSLEEVYLTYKYKDFKLKLGRQIHQTPLLNENNNRMRPNLFQGLNINYNYNNLKLSAAWFISEHVRGTTSTYSVANSYGIYGQGIHPSGEKNDYHNNISSLGIGVFGAQYKLKNWKTQVWNFIGENVFNLAFLQSDYKFINKNTEYIFGVQGIYQTALNNGGNNNSMLAYIQKEEKTLAIGGRIGVEFIQQHKLSFNYLGISNQGRYLFPREWGREIFYSSQSRELFEGYGGLNAYVLKYKFSTKHKSYSILLGAGIIDQPDIDNYRLNKYALADYYHFSIDINYSFKNYLKGIHLRFLTVYKKEFKPESMTTIQKNNKVEMINLNFVIDYNL